MVSAVISIQCLLPACKRPEDHRFETRPGNNRDVKTLCPAGRLSRHKALPLGRGPYLRHFSLSLGNQIRSDKSCTEQYFPVALFIMLRKVTLTFKFADGLGGLYYYIRNFCSLIGLEQWYFSLI